MHHYQKIQQKLIDFINKYHRIVLYKGIFQFLFFTFLIYLTYSFSEYWLYFPSLIRAVILFSFIFLSIFLLIKNIIIPSLYLLNILNKIDNTQAISILKKYFSEKEMHQLQSAIELKQINKEDEILIQAAIEQKSKNLQNLNFSNSIQFKWKNTYFLLSLPLMVSFLIILFWQPQILKESNERIVNYQVFYQPEAYFTFNLLNEDLNIESGQHLTISMKLEGSRIPDELYVVVDQKKYKMSPEASGVYTYTFQSVNSNIKFRAFADGYFSSIYEINPLELPNLNNAFLNVTPPQHTSLTPFKTNQFNIKIPEGSKVQWNLNYQNNVAFLYRDTLQNWSISNSNKIIWDSTIYRSFPYHFKAISKDQIIHKSPQYFIETIPDLYPKITIKTQEDSLNINHFIIEGKINDDYGFHSLYIYYKNSQKKEYLSQKISINTTLNNQSFYYYLNAEDLGAEEIEFYLEVRDNDIIHQYKSTTSPHFKNKIKSLFDQKNILENKGKSIKNNLEKSLKESQQLKEQFESLKKSIQNKKTAEWEQKEALKKLLEAQEKLKQQIESIQEENQKKLDELEKIEENQALIEKQKELQKLLDQLMNDELKSMMDEISALMDEMDQEEMKMESEQLKEENKNLEAELDRALELYKRMELEQKASDIAEKMKDLSEKLQEESDKNRQKNNENGAAKQEELKKAYEDLKEELKELKELNKDLDKPLPLDTEEKPEVSNAMEEASEQLEKEQEKKAADAQQKAAEGLQEMSEQMSSSLSSAQDEQQGEDLAALRQILDNLLVLSFQQEDIQSKTKVLNANDPLLNDLAKDQKNLLNYTSIIEDSLRNLAKRVVQISSTINEHLNGISYNINSSLGSFHEREMNLIPVYQQKTMMHFNELANLLDDAMQQMQQQMQSNKSGKGSCSKPGGEGSGEPKMPSLREMQEAMSKKLEQLKKDLEKQKGNNPGKDGSTPLPMPGGTKKGKSLSQQLSEGAQQQSEIKKKLMQLRDEQSGNKEMRQELDRIIDDIENNEKDFYKKDINQQTLYRQQEILIKMLEFENAEKEQGEDEKRESNSAQQKNATEEKLMEDYLKKRQKELEQKKSIDPTFKPYYQNKSQNYFENKNRNGNNN